MKNITKKLGLVLSCLLLVFSIIPNKLVKASEIQPRWGGATGYHHKVEFVNTYKKNKEFVGYHKQTSNWSKASSYTLTESYTVGSSISGSSTGLTGLLSKTKGTSANVTIKANKSKYSKVGIYADFTYGKYKVSLVENWSGRVVKTWYSTVKTPTNVYQTVVYK